jgi:geranylgeranyl reductase family protein
MRPTTMHADVVVVGAGPGGATAAAWLARAGRDVLLLEKDRFPRDKVCGDGLTPRVVRELQLLGLHDEAAGRVEGWSTSKGLRIHGGATVMELPWPELDDWPNWGAACTRAQFDHTLAKVAVADGATLWEGVTAHDLEWRDPVSRDRIQGVVWRDEDGNEGVVRAPIVIASDGASSKLGIKAGLHRRDDRPMAVAARTYYRSPRSTDDHISSFLDLTDGEGNLLSGYGWIFPLDDGSLNVGLGLLNTSKDFRGTNYRKLLQQWATGMEDEWGTTAEHQFGGIGSGPIPMGFNRTPIHRKGLLLVGDSAGMVNPFNGEGISYAMEAARLAAEVADEALRQKSTVVLDRYDAELRARWGGYYTLGKLFTHIVGSPTMMDICTTYGMPIEPLMHWVLKIMAHLTDARPSDVHDVIINTMQNVAPAA